MLPFALLLLQLLLLQPAAQAELRFFNSTNAVNGCGSSCSNKTAPFVCLGGMPSLGDCKAACARFQAGRGCDILTYSPWSKHCWTRTDDKWAPVGSGIGNVAGCDPARVKGCGPHPPPYTGAIKATIGTHPAASAVKTHPATLSVALDFWLPHDPNCECDTQHLCFSRAWSDLHGARSPQTGTSGATPRP